jgi:prepilin-type N-terminal cleavage/methylation domain-containing protein
MMRLKSTEGFSLVEVMTVIAIIGIITAIALPTYISGMPHRRLKSAARDLYGAMQQARLLAVKKNHPVHVCFNTGADSYFLDDDGDLNLCDTPPVKQIDLKEKYYDVQFGRGDAPSSKPALGAFDINLAPYITFLPAGTAQFETENGPNAVYIENITSPSEKEKESFAVAVMDSGAVKISWYDGKGNWK